MFVPLVLGHISLRLRQEMYADVDARGGILEPPGIVEVKYRAHQQVAPMMSVRNGRLRRKRRKKTQLIIIHTHVYDVIFMS